MLKILTALIVLATPALAQTADNVACSPRKEIVETLTKKFGETRVGFGLTEENVIMEIWANPETGSFSVTVTDTGGQTCLDLKTMTGTGWTISAAGESL